MSLGGLVVFNFFIVLCVSATRWDWEQHYNQQTTTFRSLKEAWFTQNIDHFNWRTKGTFQQRYFYDDQYWIPQGPIFLYTGNESPIETFINNTGFIFDIAPKFKALVIFIEHRYYGQSFPYGSPSIALQPGHIDYLTVEQALADFSVFIASLNTLSPFKNNAQNSAVICFGGSYGGNLALWMRTKYPNLVAGAIVSSAPPQKRLMRSSNVFNRIVTEVYANVSTKCPVVVRSAFDELMEKAKTVVGRQEISTLLGICTPLPSEETANAVYNWIYNGLETMVQYGYPYPTSFYNPVPGLPFKVACESMLNSMEASPLGALKGAIDVYYNWTGEGGQCYSLEDMYDISKLYKYGSLLRLDDDPTSFAWYYQCCTEVYQPMPTDGITDMFLPYTPNATQIFSDCNTTFGVTPRIDWEEMSFWGAHIETASNLFLTNGQLDPWRSGGILECDKCSESVILRELEGAAHHLDLRASNLLDPLSVTLVREEEQLAITKWIAEWEYLL